MSLTKRISGDYNIVSVGTTDNVSITTNTVTVNGNLVVSGATTTISTTNSAITDNIIVLNDGESGAGVTATYAGILIDRGSSANVSLRWNESNDKWQITEDGSTYANIATTSGTGFITEVADDTSPTLGGNLDLGGFSLTGTNVVLDPTGNITLSSNVQFVGTSTVTVTAATAGAGGTGLFADSSELASKTKARKFAIIFG
jgi:hypothetical protein